MDFTRQNCLSAKMTTLCGVRKIISSSSWHMILCERIKNSKIENKMCSPTNFPCFHGQLYDKNTIG